MSHLIPGELIPEDGFIELNKGREVRSTQDPDKKLDLLSQQVSALAALTLVGISVGGDGLLSKGGILSGLFT